MEAGVSRSFVFPMMASLATLACIFAHHGSGAETVLKYCFGRMDTLAKDKDDWNEREEA